MARRETHLIVEVADPWVKLIRLVPKGIGWQIDQLACDPVDDDQAMSRWLREKVVDRRGKTGPLLLVLPRHQVMIRHLQLPSQDVEEMAQMVSLQVPSLVPYAVSEAVWSFQPLGSKPGGFTEVMVAVAHRPVIERLLKIMEGASLLLERISVSSLGLVEWLKAALQRKLISLGGLIVLIDLNASSLEIDLIEEGIPLFTRAAPFSPQGMPDAPLAEIRRTLATASREIRGKRIDQVILTGVSSFLDSVATSLGKDLEVEVKTLDSFSPLGVADTAEIPNREATSRCSFTALVGLGMESDGTMTLLPPEFLARRTVRRQRLQWVVTTALLGAVIASGIGALGGPLMGRQLQLKRVEQGLKAMESSVAEVERMRQQLEIVSQYRLVQGLPLKVLQELYARVPSEVALTLVVLDSKSSLLLKGQAPSMAGVLSLVTALEESPHFDNVQVRYANKRVFQTKEIADFEIQCPLLSVKGQEA